MLWKRLSVNRAWVCSTRWQDTQRAFVDEEIEARASAPREGVGSPPKYQRSKGESAGDQGALEGGDGLGDLGHGDAVAALAEDLLEALRRTRDRCGTIVQDGLVIGAGPSPPDW